MIIHHPDTLGLSAKSTSTKRIDQTLPLPILWSSFNMIMDMGLSLGEQQSILIKLASFLCRVYKDFPYQAQELRIIPKLAIIILEK
jgi:hypothetical protein